MFWSEQSKRSLHGLEREIVIRIIRKIKLAQADPYRFLKKLKGEKAWKLRVGDYRVLIDIDHEKNFLYILEVGHRRNIYKY